MTLSVILPCHNEENAIEPVLQEILEQKKYLLHKGTLSELEVIVVDDKSTDQSCERVQAFAPHGVWLIHLDEKKGYGAALKAGIEKARGDYVALYDLDTTCSARDLERLLHKALKNNHHMVSGMRLHAQSSMPLIRQMGNRFYSLMVWVFFGASVQDVCSGYRLFRKQCKPWILESLPDELNFTLSMTLYCLKHKLSFEEIPISYKERSGESKLHPLKDGLLFSGTILRWFFKRAV